MGFDAVAPGVHDLVMRLMREYGLFVPGDAPLQILGGVWKNTDAGDVRADKLAAKLETLGPGTWLMIEHAAIDSPETRAIGHPGYEFVAADRSAVLAAWTSPKVMDVIKRRGIVLTSRRRTDEAVAIARNRSEPRNPEPRNLGTSEPRNRLVLPPFD